MKFTIRSKFIEMTERPKNLMLYRKILVQVMTKRYWIKRFLCPLATVGRSVCRSVGLSVCRPSVVRSISFDPFTWSISNLVQGLPSISRWSLLIFRSHVQRSRSNHSSQPTVLSAQYLLISSLDQYQTWCRSCSQ